MALLKQTTQIPLKGESSILTQLCSLLRMVPCLKYIDTNGSV